MESTIGIRCVIVEDQAMFAELLASLLRVSPGIPLQIVETVRTVAAGKAACELRRPDLLLLDIALPDGSGLAVLEHLIAVHPEGRAIVVSGHATSFICPRPLSRLVYAVIDKCDAFHKLQSVINRFASQHRPAGVRVGGESLPERVPLSTREKEILLLIGRGKTSLAIAEELGISVHTVNVHRKKVAAKLGVRGNELRLQAFRYCQAVDSHRGTPSAE